MARLDLVEEGQVYEMPASKFHQLRMAVPRSISEINSKRGVVKRGTDIQVRVAQVAKLLQLYRELAQKGLPYNLFGHFGDGHLHFNFMPTADQVGDCDRYFEQLYREVLKMKASPFAEHGVGIIKQKYIRPFLQDVHFKMFKYLKSKMDARNIFFPNGYLQLMITVQVYKTDGRELTCKRPDTHEVITARVSGNSVKDGGIVVGDYLELAAEGAGFKVLGIRPRRNEVYRMLVREKKKKVSASNVDYMVIVCSISKPTYKRGLIDRYLVRAEQWDIQPLVIFNKMDEYAKRAKDFDLEFELERLEYRKIPCFQMSSKGLDFSPVGKNHRGGGGTGAKIGAQDGTLYGPIGSGKEHIYLRTLRGKDPLKERSDWQVGEGKTHHQLE